ncbi:hypothetical protein KIPB_009530, partial [Kipferlia bialata]|eukprot:g9530.t1
MDEEEGKVEAEMLRLLHSQYLYNTSLCGIGLVGIRHQRTAVLLSLMAIPGFFQYWVPEGYKWLDFSSWDVSLGTGFWVLIVSTVLYLLAWLFSPRRAHLSNMTPEERERERVGRRERRKSRARLARLVASAYWMYRCLLGLLPMLGALLMHTGVHFGIVKGSPKLIAAESQDMWSIYASESLTCLAEAALGIIGYKIPVIGTVISGLSAYKLRDELGFALFAGDSASDLLRHFLHCATG